MDLHSLFEPWKKHSIYRIPAYMKDQNPEAYTPQLVSIGPYHHGASHLAAMEVHKARSLKQFLVRTKKCLEDFRNALRPVTSSLLESYQQLDEKWREDPDKFLQLMVVDGSFLCEFLHGCFNGWDCYDPKDPVFSFDALLNTFSYIIPDVLMMENQIPLLVIERLIAVQTGQLNEKNDEKAVELVYKFLSCPMPVPSIAPGLHVLDVSRKVITKNFHQQSSKSERLPAAVVKSAWKLSDVGVRFRANTDTGKGISFQDGVLNLPFLKFDSSIELFFLNAIAFEKLHPTAGREVGSYVAFLRGLIRCARDVRTLTSHCIIENSFGSDEAVADLMKRISKNVFFDPHSELCEVRNSLNYYYAKKMTMKRHSIYRIPAYMKGQNRKAYTPQLVSIGPYHHGASHLAAMEVHKARSLQQFLDRTNQPIEAYRNALRPLTSSLLESYHQLDAKWRINPDRFLHLMVVDGSFLCEFLHGCSNGWDYHPKDPVFSFDALLNTCPYIIPDVLMMENQIPLVVIERLIAVQTGQLNEINDEKARELVYKFLSCPMPSPSIAPGLHVLDVSRIAITKNFHEKSSASERLPGAVVISARKLSDVGVRFRAITATGKGISFWDGVLNLPLLKFDGSIEPRFLNAIAFEKLHPMAGREVSSYVAFMGGLISCARDVSTLTSQCVIENAVGSDEAVAELMNRISKNVLFDPYSELCQVRDSLNEYYAKKMKNMRRRLRIRFRRRRRVWWRNLMHTYFKNPWTVLSLLAATFLLVLTLLQTIYTMKGYYKGS